MERHPTIEKLLGEIEEFRRKSGLNATAFGRLAVGDGNFIRAIRSGGRTPSLQTLDRVRTFMKTYRRSAKVVA
jgi:hypothetical protein